MTNFNQLQSRLAQAQADARAAASKLFRDRQRLARAERERAAASRVAKGRAGHDPELADWDAKIESREASVRASRVALDAAREAASARLEPFLDLTDPREHLDKLSDATPVLLMPLRMETRFRMAGAAVGAGGELWVRVFPDDFVVDTFEETLSESELRRIKAYWTGIWSAGGVEGDQRGVWKVLAGSVGSGRARWLQETYFPAGDPPVKSEGVPSVILAIPTEEELPDTESTALAVFWEAHWRAGEDTVAQVTAANALSLAVGNARAEALRQSHVPSNLADPAPEGTDPASVPVEVAFVVFPPGDDMPIREHSWTRAPSTELMPDRLVLLGFNGGEKALDRLGNPIPDSLVMAPDPDADEENQLKPEGPEGEDITLGTELEWLADFEKAVEIGMGFRIPLDPLSFRTGFDQLMVLGVRLKASAEAGQSALEQLITHHKQSRAGFEILPQGTPTNNVETEGAGYSRKSDADTSFERYFRLPPDNTPGWFDKNDGRWLADTLGLSPELFADVAGARGGDIRDAMAMNTLLWPATAGYFMDAMLDTVFNSATISRTRDFFVRHVTARGAIPAIRVGRQPYGILPATPRSRIAWLKRRRITALSAAGADGGHDFSFLRRVYTILQKVENDWRELDGQVSWIGKPGVDQHQVLLDILGLHPGSVEHYQRYAESYKQLFNRMRMEGAGGNMVAAITALAYVITGQELLNRLGHVPDEDEPVADILEKLFLRDPNLLKGGLVQDVPLSESDPVRAYTSTGDNYLSWLIGASETSHDALRLQQGFDGATPRALLYLIARHALDLSYVEVSRLLLLEAGLMTPARHQALRREAQFLHVETEAMESPAQAVQSRWSDLYRAEPAITGSTTEKLGSHIPKIITTHVATAYLSRQLDAMRRLEHRPSAALERAFTEHLDLLTYRLDAWYNGILSWQLERMRFGSGGSPATVEPGTGDEVDPIDGSTAGQPPNVARGLYLGAYGWLEDVRPEFKTQAEVDLPPDLEQIFKRTGDAPVTTDNRNAGYIHAPSLNHAVTAAVLRNGYLSNATPANPGSLAINLSSERVRMALQIIEGMKSGQSLGALLGYQFERGLHDRHDVEVDSFIYELRTAFPLVAGRLRATRIGRFDELGKKLNIRKAEARNVIDGLALVEHMRETGAKTYPFGKGDELPAASSAQQAAITAEADRLANIADATADLAMAESVHQVVQGNYERAGATLDTFSKGKFPSTPDVIRTPRSGTGLTHRVGLHLPTGLNPATAPGDRARSEPALNEWLEGQLPQPARVVCQVKLIDPDDQSETRVNVSQADLGLSALDLLYLLDVDDEPSMRALDDLIERHVIAALNLRPDIKLEIGYIERLGTVPDHVPFMELTALMRPLRALLLRSRPLRPTDLAMAQEAERKSDAGPFIDTQRISLNRTALDSARTTLTAFEAPLTARVGAQEIAQIAVEIDGNISAFATNMGNLAPFSSLRGGTGRVYADWRKIYAALKTRLSDYTERWTTRLAEFDAVISDYDALPPATDDSARMLALQKAERLIAIAATDPLPAMPAVFRTSLVGTRRTAFAGQLATLDALGSAQPTISGLVAAIEAEEAANANFMPEPIDLEADFQAILTLAEDMSSQAAALIASLDTLIDMVDTRLAEAGAASNGRAQTAALTAAAKALFGEEFQIVPQFTLPPPLAQELVNAWGPGASADTAILDHVQTTLGQPFPVDDWLHGAARVREQMRNLESAGMLAEAFNSGGLPLQPLQLPHRPGTPWLALDLPETDADGNPFAIDEDKLLYTAHYPAALQPAGPIAGLLLDEWTEVIPSRSEETGLAVHYDRPNSEAPQTMLLALPADFTGAWDWQDLVDTVRETMDMARLRAIEPDQIDTTAYAHFLPATVSAVTFKPITAALNLALNNGLITALESQESGDA